MKKIFINILFSFLLCLSYSETKAQSIEGTGPDCLGIWCTIDVSLSDPVVNNRLVYTIPTPPDEITGIYGPGMPYFFNNLGNTVDLYLNKFDLIPQLDDTDEYTILDLEMTVNHYVNGYEGHYHIKLVLRR